MSSLTLLATLGLTLAAGLALLDVPASAGAAEIERVDAEAVIAACEGRDDAAGCLEREIVEQNAVVASLLLALQLRDGDDPTESRRGWDEYLRELSANPCPGSCDLILRDILAERNFYQDMPHNAAPDVLIDACWHLSLGRRSTGSSQLHRQGSLFTALCLEWVILDQLEVLFPPGSPAEEHLSRVEARAKLDQLRKAYGSL